MTRTVVRGGCAHDCPDSCAWLATVEDGRAVDLRGNPDHPFTRGGLCAKVERYLDRVYSPDRLLHPLRRSGPKGSGRFEPVAWEAALGEIAERLLAVAAEHGAEAILPYSFAGNMGLIQSRSLDRRLWAAVGASRLARTVCGGTANAGIAGVLGSTLGGLPEHLRHSRTIVLWGTNTLVTNLHLWPFIREARAAGARVIAVDPLRTRTAAAADWHLQPLPGSDVALVLGLIQVIVAEGLHDREYIEAHTNGFEALHAQAAAYPPARVAELTGLAAGSVVALARELATAQPAAIRTVLGPEKHPQGAATYRLLASLPAITGAWRHLGGGLFPDTRAVVNDTLDVGSVGPPHQGAKTHEKAREINMIQLGRALTDPDLEPPVKALFVYNANPAVTTPNSNLVVEGLRREDLFTVVHEQFMTDTALHADFVLPATGMLEHLDLLYPWGHATVVLNRPAIEPPGDCVSNNELFRRLARALGREEPELQASEEDLIRGVLASGHPWMEGVTYERLWEEGWAPIGMPDDWKPYAEGGFRTASGRCELAAAPLPDYVPPVADPAHPLTLVSAKLGLHFLNSSYSHLPRHAAAEGEPAVHLHADDARARGIADGDRVRVRNARGVLELVARVDGVARPGVVAVAFGFWRRPGNPGANALTGDDLSDGGGGGAFYSARVEVDALS